MPFPFVPFGVVVAGMFLGSALTLFALALRGLDRATASIGDSVLPGLVEGIRDWSMTGRGPDRPPTWSPATSPDEREEADEADEPFEPVLAEPVPAEPVHRSTSLRS